MRSLFLTKQVENNSLDYSKDLFVNRRPNFVKPVIALAQLAQNLNAVPGLDAAYEQYVREIIRVYRILNTVKPRHYDRVHTKFFLRFVVDMDKKISINNISKAFYIHISDAMRYDAVREKEFLPYAKKLGIRACVYCNANYALSIKQGNSDYGKFELDHYKPQSKFPYLCTNFYNLTPSCSNCNKYKLNKSVQFCLYTEDHNRLSPFKFRLDRQSIVKYLLSQNFEDLKIEFDSGGDVEHENIFKIQATYNVLKDVIEELIWKHKIYSPSYISSLNIAFGKKFNSRGFYRFILGNYDLPNDIHKRPLAKLVQDIARQLGMIV